MPQYFHRKNSRGRAKGSRKDREGNNLERDDDPRRRTEGVAHHSAQHRYHPIRVLDLPELMMAELPDDIVDRAGGEKTVEAAAKSQVRTIFESEKLPLLANGKPDSGERARHVGGDEEIAHVRKQRDRSRDRCTDANAASEIKFDRFDFRIHHDVSLNLQLERCPHLRPSK